MKFRYNGKEYLGSSPSDVVRALERDADDYPQRGKSIRDFLRWSLEHLCDSLPPRDLDLSDRLEDDELALNYLYLRDEYGAGEFLDTDVSGKRIPSSGWRHTSNQTRDAM